MTQVTDKRIIAASLLVLDAHYGDTKRPLRALVDTDFERIRTAKKRVAQQWYIEKTNPHVQYAAMRSEMLDTWMKKHHWHITTRNLYSSVLSKLTVWEQHGISPHDSARLQELQAGARLFLQFLKSHEMQLV
jgi:hypothetical protein